MEDILRKIYPHNENNLINDILSLYDKQKYVISNFIYFPLIKQENLFDSRKRTTQQKEYRKFIMNSDFLLPDWMALQTYYMMANRFWFNLPTKRLSNLNWTDFVPLFLDEIKKRYWSQRLKITLYWSKKEIVQECKNILSFKWFNIEYIQDWYSDFNRDEFEKINKNMDIENPINVILIARWTPTQELWTQKNFSRIKNNKLIVFTVWWLFDFIAATSWKKIEWTQKRAPLFIRKLRLEWLWRFITDPKRNWKKIKNTLCAPWYVFKYLLLKKS